MENTITAITGWRGSGKTCFMTALLYQYHLQGFKVFANYHLHFPYTYITLKEVAELPDSLRNSVIGLDEIQVGADAREIFKAGNKGINKLVTQLRKRKCALFYTTQRWKYPDLRLRDQVNQHIHVEAVETYDEDDNKINGIMDLIYYDRTLSIPDMIKNAKQIRFDGRRYFSLYDTDEIIEYDTE